MRTEADADLIERAQRDRAAFAEIYDLYLQRVYAFCLSHSGDRDDAEDLTAQTFERAMASIARYDNRGVPLSSWLFRIASNLIVDRGRKSGRIVLLGNDAPPENPRQGANDDDPEGMVLRWERAAQLRQIMGTLPADQQHVLRLRFWEGHSILEIAAQLGRSEGAIKQLLHRAVHSLRGRIDVGVVVDA